MTTDTVWLRCAVLLLVRWAIMVAVLLGVVGLDAPL